MLHVMSLCLICNRNKQGLRMQLTLTFVTSVCFFLRLLLTTGIFQMELKINLLNKPTG